MKTKQIEMALGALLLALGIELFIWARFVDGTVLALGGDPVAIGDIIRYNDNFQLTALILMPIGAAILSHGIGAKND